MFQIDSKNSVEDIFYKLSEYFVLKSIKKDSILWYQGDCPDCLYLVEEGSLKSSVVTSSNIHKNVESIMDGSCVGELTFFTNRPRMTTLVANTDCKLWMFTSQSLTKLKEKDPRLLVDFMQISLCYSAMDMNNYSIHAFDLI